MWQDIDKWKKQGNKNVNYCVQETVPPADEKLADTNEYVKIWDNKYQGNDRVEHLNCIREWK